MLHRLVAVLLWFAACCCSITFAAERPNILLVVADDLGYSDLGCYGGEIQTPSLDALAAEGVRFTGFHVNPMCVVTRTSLMTGHTHFQSNEYRNSLPIARLMAAAGYETMMVGKWHQPGHPMDAGFQHFYGFLEGQIDSWTGVGYGHRTIRTDRQEPRDVPPGWYSTDAFTDSAVQQIDASIDAGKPFFSYVAYNAPHTPLHAPKENVDKYPALYRDGWSVLRSARFQRMMEMGLIDERYQLSEPGAEVRRWEELREVDRQVEADRMAAYAGMVDRLDENVGRLISHLRKRNVLDNTLVVFISDNGGDYGNGSPDSYARELAWVPGSNPMVSNGWGMLKNTPFNWYKHTTAAGVRSPMIVRCPTLTTHPAGSILSQRLHVTDLYPTFAQIAGAEYPADDAGRKLKPLYGSSMIPLFNDSSLAETAIHDEIFWCFITAANQRGLVAGPWKIVSINDGPWLLYDLQSDPGESRDVADQNPEQLAQLIARWHEFADQETVIPKVAQRPVTDDRQGWGLHRIRMIMPGLQTISPAQALTDVNRQTELVLEFDQPADFTGTFEKTLRLYRVSDPTTAIWQIDPDEKSQWQGQRRLVFNDLPELQSDTSYFVVCDPGWVRINGNASGPLNDGAYWWRFRTKDFTK
jgi:arylsulfatase